MPAMRKPKNPFPLPDWLTGQGQTPNVADFAGLGELSAPVVSLTGILPEAMKASRSMDTEFLNTTILNGPAWSDEVKAALKYAQEKYPRLFSHITDITGVTPDVESSLGPDAVVRGASRSVRSNPKLSEVQLSPSANAHTVGHELLHNADHIAIPDFNRAYYNSLKLPGGMLATGEKVSPYSLSNFEIRANNMGEKFANDLKASGPKAFKRLMRKAGPVS